MARTYTGSQYYTLTGKLGSPATITVAGWFRSTDTGTKRIGVAIGGDGINLGFRFGALYAFYHSGAGYHEFQFAGTCNNDTWYHLVMMANPGGSSQKAYVDGVEVASDTLTNAITYAGSDSYIGSNNGSDLMEGRSAEVAAWTVALTADEIAALAKGFSPALVRPSALAFYSPMVRAVQDTKGGALSATGSPTVSDHIRIFNPAAKHVVHKAAGGTTTTVSPAAASLTLSGQNAMLRRGFKPSAASLVTAGQTPQLKLKLSPAAATLTTTPSTPGITVGRTLTPAAATLTISGQTAQLKLKVSPAAASLATSASTPGITIGTVVRPSAASLTLTASTSQLKLKVSPAVVALTATRSTPGITIGTVIRPSAGSLTTAGQTPVLKFKIPPAAASLVTSSTAPPIRQGVRPTAASLSLSGQTPRVRFGYVPTARALVTAGQTPGLRFGILPGVRALTITLSTPGVDTGEDVPTGYIDASGGATGEVAGVGGAGRIEV